MFDNNVLKNFLKANCVDINKFKSLIYLDGHINNKKTILKKLKNKEFMINNYILTP